jgi:predicted glycoside hydrolase/deacetylase ChbG (UPF0249 family)
MILWIVITLSTADALTTPIRLVTMSAMNKFMFVADDLGISTEANRGVELAHRAGVVRFVSLMVFEKAADDAVAMIRKYPDMIVGIHLKVDDLIGVDPAVWAGTRCEGLLERLGNPGLRSRIRQECERQIEAYFSLGFTPTFLNSHFSVHAIPALFDIFLDLADTHGFGFMRFSPNNPLLEHPDLMISDKDLQSMAVQLADRGIGHADWYRPTFCYFYPPELSAGITEIAFHPAWGDSEIGYLDLARLLSWGNILEATGTGRSVI